MQPTIGTESQQQPTMCHPDHSNEEALHLSQVFTEHCKMQSLTPPASPEPTEPWWYEDALETRDREDPEHTMEWDLEWETPIVPSQVVADVLQGAGKSHGLPWWATRDGGFSMKDRSLSFGFKSWTEAHSARWSEVQTQGYVAGHYDRTKRMWGFENFETFCSEMRDALAYVDHPKSLRWVHAIDAWNPPVT